MRQGQQNRRGRGRGGNNNAGRKGQNPLTRSFESNGPEMKIRGTPAHIAEKYTSLARDALSGGDPVLAENYLQHAEHYNRIILTYREQQVQQNSNDGVNGSSNNARNRNQTNGAPAGAERSGDVQSAQSSDQSSGFIPVQPDAPQPVIQDDAPRERNAGRSSRSSRQDGQRSTRGRNAGGQRSSRSNGQKVAAEGEEAQGSAERSDRQREPRRGRNRFGDSDEQPQFLRRPVRRSRTAQAKQDASQSDSASVEQEPSQPQPAADDQQD